VNPWKICPGELRKKEKGTVFRMRTIECSRMLEEEENYGPN
jgi:hypothetical protein